MISFGQLEYLTDIKHWDYHTVNTQSLMSEWDKLNGKIHKIIYEDDDRIFGVEYNKKGQIVFSRYSTEHSREEILASFDAKGNLDKETVSCYGLVGVDLVKLDDEYLKYRTFDDEDNATNNAVILGINPEDLIFQITADKINQLENTREIFQFILNSTDVKHYVKDSVFIKKMLDYNVAKASFENGDIINLNYEKRFYDKKFKITKIQPIYLSNQESKKIQNIDFQYLTDSSGITLNNGEKYLTFKLRSNGSEFTLDYAEISDEKFTYDEKGNWRTHEYSEIRDGKKRKRKSKRFIEYFED
jgi:hypothetical protein